MRYLEVGFAVVYVGLLMAILLSLGGFLLSCPASASGCPNGASLFPSAGTYAGAVVALAGGGLIVAGLAQKTVRERWLSSLQGQVVGGFALAYLGLMLSLVASYGGTLVLGERVGTWLAVTPGTYAGGALSIAGWGLVAAGLLRGRARGRQPRSPAV